MRTALLLSALCVVGYSQNPPPAPTEPSQPKQQKGTTKSDRLSPIDPAFSTSPLKSNPSTERGKDKSSPDWWMVGLTAVVVVIYWFQWRAMRATLKETERAATAAANSADIAKQAFLSQHRPKLVVRRFSPYPKLS